MNKRAKDIKVPRAGSSDYDALAEYSWQLATDVAWWTLSEEAQKYWATTIARALRQVQKIEGGEA